MLWQPDWARTSCLSSSKDAHPSTAHSRSGLSLTARPSIWPQWGSEGMVGEQEGTRQGLSANSLLTESPKSSGSSGHASPAHSRPASVPASSQHSANSSLRHYQGRDHVPRPPPGQPDGTTSSTEPEPHLPGPQGPCLISACSTNQTLSTAKPSFPSSWPCDSRQISDVPEHRKEAVMRPRRATGQLSLPSTLHANKPERRPRRVHEKRPRDRH